MIEWIALGALSAATASSASPSSPFKAWPIQRWCRGLQLPPEAPFTSKVGWAFNEYGVLSVNYKAIQHTNFYPIGLGAIFMSERDRLESVAYELLDVEDWSMWRDFEYQMKVTGKSWPGFNLFPELAPWRRPVGQSSPPAASRVFSPNGTWSYANQALPLASAINIFMPVEEVEYDMREWMEEEGLLGWGDDNARGTVVFDGDILIPTVYEGDRLWMSHTPAEILSQRGGLAYARGHVIVGGLGLGWFLAQVIKNPKVTRVTLIEMSEELVDWLMPRICAMLSIDKRVDVIIGDVNDVLPYLTADAALLDIWPTYGDIEDEMFALRERIPSKQIRTIWGWGHGNPVV